MSDPDPLAPPAEIAIPADAEPAQSATARTSTATPATSTTRTSAAAPAIGLTSVELVGRHREAASQRDGEGDGDETHRDEVCTPRSRRASLFTGAYAGRAHQQSEEPCHSLTGYLVLPAALIIAIAVGVGLHLVVEKPMTNALRRHMRSLPRARA